MREKNAPRYQRQTPMLGVTLSEPLFREVDEMARREKRKRASMARVLIEEAIEARRKEAA